jgi:rhodanese-related sulfurtransferase/DNA-binding MarR family transcriptional regulator
MDRSQLPDSLYEKFALIGKALSSPTRLQVLNLLCQRDHSVSALAEKTGESTANLSAHLQKLSRANLVSRRKEGRRVVYGVPNDRIVQLWLAVRDTGLEEMPEVRELMREYASDPPADPDLAGEEILERVRADDIVLLDLRPTSEFEAGHLPQARSLPFEELERRLDELPEQRQLVAYCRGPYCVAAIRGVERLREEGFDVQRMPGGVAEWRAAGLPLETT